MNFKEEQDKRRKNRQIQLIIRLFGVMIGTILLLAVLFWDLSKGSRDPSLEQGKENTSSSSSSELSETVSTPAPTKMPQLQVDFSDLYSPYAVLKEVSDDRVIAEHASQDRIYPASLTKIMTAILAIENTPDLSEKIRIPSEYFQALYQENASMAGFEPGEEASLRDILYGVMLPSGAECCMTFAERIGGSEAQFVDLMNSKAAELGMKNTHFMNTTGLQDPQHYSTVDDISILLEYALKNDEFRKVFTSESHTTDATSVHPNGITFRSTMFKYMDTAEVKGGAILGGKTGYTSDAGLCLASLAEINGREYIFVTAKASGTHQTEQYHILDAVNVYNQIGSMKNE